ncbi:hypothetical protein BT63DRAFT_479897 [Microthyrium microscopicum]|uniref:ATPase inhibitor, mitochondrial n=1 Tax=Microthyrium microscopicum TaxID=703497 RepID=A0A6A6U8A2_9PEZI|nr:hypothetical protein BT63DRAFT_479897 [Microthyrium microscopicum]
MLRTTFARSIRTFTTARPLMAAGDTGAGAGRPTGAAGGDAFTKREKGQEDMWVKNEERQKLMALKEKLGAQKKHITELEKEIDNMVNKGDHHGE